MIVYVENQFMVEPNGVFELTGTNRQMHVIKVFTKKIRGSLELAAPTEFKSCFVSPQAPAPTAGEEQTPQFAGHRPDAITHVLVLKYPLPKAPSIRFFHLSC